MGTTADQIPRFHPVVEVTGGSLEQRETLQVQVIQKGLQHHEEFRAGDALVLAGKRSFQNCSNHRGKG